MELHLGGHLWWYAPRRVERLDIALGAPTPLAEIVAGLGLPRGEIAFATVNDTVVRLREATVGDADRVELFPPNCGG